MICKLLLTFSIMKCTLTHAMNNLKDAVKDSIVCSKDLQDKLDAQKKELENVNQEYDNKVKEITDDFVVLKQMKCWKFMLLRPIESFDIFLVSWYILREYPMRSYGPGRSTKLPGS